MTVRAWLSSDVWRFVEPDLKFAFADALTYAQKGPVGLGAGFRMLYSMVPADTIRPLTGRVSTEEGSILCEAFRENAVNPPPQN